MKGSINAPVQDAERFLSSLNLISVGYKFNWCVCCVRSVEKVELFYFTYTIQGLFTSSTEAASLLRYG